MAPLAEMKPQSSVWKTSFVLVLAILLNVTAAIAKQGEKGAKGEVSSGSPAEGLSAEGFSLRSMRVSQAKGVLALRGPRLEPHIRLRVSRVAGAADSAQVPGTDPSDVPREGYGDAKGRAAWRELMEAFSFLGLLGAVMAILMVSLYYLELVDPSP